MKEHKCKGCIWGKLTGTKYYCMLPRCVKDKSSPAGETMAFNGLKYTFLILI